MFPRYLQYLLTDFRQTFVTGASWDTDDLITFFGQKVKVQGHTIAAEAHSTRRYRRVQLFLVYVHRRLASREGIASLGVRLSDCVCVCVRHISLCGEGNALCPVLSSSNKLMFMCDFSVFFVGIVLLAFVIKAPRPTVTRSTGLADGHRRPKLYCKRTRPWPRHHM